MAITDKTRKLLWGRSGNRCAICKKELIVDRTPFDDESVVGDECHMISSQPNGPRYEPTFATEKLDEYQNLILLCRVHHKQIDDQSETFSTEILRQTKTTHEVWVSERLTERSKREPFRLCRAKENIPSFLSRMFTGRDLLNLVANVVAYSFDHDDLRTEAEVELVARFFDTLQDYGEIGTELELGQQVQAAYDLSALLGELECGGFLAFGYREIQHLEGGNQTEASKWPVALLRILRNDSEEIIRREKEKSVAEEDSQIERQADSSASKQEQRSDS